MSKLHDVALLSLENEIKNELRLYLENFVKEIFIAENAQRNTEFFSDYIDKLFEKMYRVIKDENQIYRFNQNLIYDFLSKSILDGDKVVKLNNQEITLLEYLIKNRGITVPYETLIYVISNNSYSSMETLRTVIKRLRVKIDKSVIETISKVGYKLL